MVWSNVMGSVQLSYAEQRSARRGRLLLWAANARLACACCFGLTAGVATGSVSRAFRFLRTAREEIAQPPHRIRLTDLQVLRFSTTAVQPSPQPTAKLKHAGRNHKQSYSHSQTQTTPHPNSSPPPLLSPPLRQLANSNRGEHKQWRELPVII